MLPLALVYEVRQLVGEQLRRHVRLARAKTRPYVRKEPRFSSMQLQGLTDAQLFIQMRLRNLTFNGWTVGSGVDV